MVVIYIYTYCNNHCGYRNYMTQIEIPKNYTPSKEETEYMNPMQLEYFKRELLEWKKVLIKESQQTISHLKENSWQESDVNDRASLETDAGFELRTRDRYRKLIDKIDIALNKIEAGEYGYCDDTGDPIGVARLKARPIATLCIEAQEQHENYEKSHIDEDDVDIATS